MFDTRIFIGLDPRPHRVNALLVEPAFGSTLGQLSVPPNRILEALTAEVESWRPVATKVDFILAACPDDPWSSDTLTMLKQRFALSAQSRLRVDEILDLSSKIYRRSLKRERASLLAFLARWNPGVHSTGRLARAWALHLARDQFFHIQTEEWPDFYYDDISGEPLYEERHPLLRR